MEVFGVAGIQALLKAAYCEVQLARIHLIQQFIKHELEDYDFYGLFLISDF